MKTVLRAALLIALALSLLPTQVLAVDAARTVDLDDGENREFTWTSDTFVGAAPDFLLNAPTPYECGATVEGNCEYSLFNITGITDAEITAYELANPTGNLADLRDTVNFTVGITDYSVPVSDLDIIVWQSNAEGDKLAELGRVGDLDTDPSEEFSGAFTARGDRPVGYILLEVVYFAGAGTYDGYMRVS